MRKKLPCLLLSGALILSLAACAAGGEAPSPSQSPSQSVETDAPSQPMESAPPARPVEAAPPDQALGLPPEPTDPPAAAEDLPDRDYQPWQTAYMDFLTLLQTQKTTWEPGGEGAQVGSESYSLYDVDKDGVPELFVKFGTCEADFFARCYTLYRDNSGRDVVVMAAQFPFGHSALYTCPDKNGFLRSEGHMGYHEIYEYGPLADGEMPQEREIFSEEDVWEYTEPDKIVPGAEYIESFYTWRGEEDDSYWTGRSPYSEGKALLLPICDWEAGPAATGSSTENAQAAILAALNGEREVYGASGDHFNGDIGPAAWGEYVRILTNVPNARTTARITAHVWQDMNGDGQEECLLRLESVTERGKETWSGEDMVILSAQDGTVCAYGFGFYDDEDAFYDDGTVRQYGGDYRLSFWKDQCYQYIARRDPSARPVKWLDGSPAG